MADTKADTKELTVSERFSKTVFKQYSGEVGRLELTEHETALIQHVYIKTDMALKEAEARRKPDRNPVPITWQNVNMEKLALDTVHRVKLGLDALVPGHIYPIPYLNDRTKKYDIDLRIGYKGEEFYLQKGSMYEIRNIYTRLVYGNEKLIQYPKGRNNKVESYDLIVAEDPFTRGDLRGGFVYIEYADELRNKLIIMSKADFDERKKLAGSDKFWGPYYDRMALKTLVHEAAREIIFDPEKIDVSTLADVEAEAIPVEGEVKEANTGEEITIDNPPAEFLRKPNSRVVVDSAKREGPGF